MSWSTFAYFGNPVGMGETLKGWDEACGIERGGMMDAKLFVIGGSEEGILGLEGRGGDVNVSVEMQMLKERCEFFNCREIIEQLNY